MQTALSVNLNKIALLRNSRGRDYPNVCSMGELAIKAGASGLTIHPRPDQRHAKYGDIAPLKQLCDKYQVELNIEGYPTDELIDLCLANKVSQVTLVPDAEHQLTSDHGWKVSENIELLTNISAKFAGTKTRISLFMDCDCEEISLAKTVGAQRIELHTESYARSFENNQQQTKISLFATAATLARNCGLGVNAGHDLDLNNLAFFLQHIDIEEVSIGHALTAEALLFGWENVIKRYQNICKNNKI